MKIMPDKFGWTCIAVLYSFILILAFGCKSPPDRIAYNTIGSVDAAATKSFDGLADEAIKGHVSSNDLHTASIVYDDLHKGLLIAAISASQGTNALVPSNLFSNSLEFAKLVLTIEQKK